MGRRRKPPEIAGRAERQAFWSMAMRDDSLAMKDRLRASDLLAKSEGDYLERHEHSVQGPIQLTLNLVRPGDAD